MNDIGNVSDAEGPRRPATGRSTAWVWVAGTVATALAALFWVGFSDRDGAQTVRWVVHLLLQGAIELVREGRSGLAEIAARTGFADQSHLSRWVRRVHGVSLTQLVV